MPIKLGYVPPPMPDETIYSVLAAYSRLLPGSKLTTRLFGHSKIQARIDWPVGLEVLAAALPPGLELNAEKLLLKHTAVPVHLPFLSQARQKALRDATLRLDGGEPSFTTGVNAHVVKVPRNSRACPRCVAVDTAQGRAYWHRVHQCTGVVCPLHPDTVLHHTSLARADAGRRKAYIDIRDVELLGPVASDLSVRDLSIVGQIATSVATLMAGGCSAPGPAALRLALRDAVRSKGYAAPAGKIRLIELHSDFDSWLGQPLAEALGVPRAQMPTNASWLCRLLNRTHHSLAPILPILATTFLGLKIDAVLAAACEYVVPPVTKRVRKFGGISKTYARFEEGRTRLPKLWSDRRLSVSEIARRLEINHITVRRWAVAMGLPFPRPGARLVRPPVPRPHRRDLRELISENRNIWLKAVKGLQGGASRNPRTASLYGWLLRYDRDWLRAHMPRPDLPDRVDWPKRDTELAARVPATVVALLRSPRLRRISRSRLAYALGHPLWLFHNKERMPKTLAAIAAETETHSEFFVRRLSHLHRLGTLKPYQLRKAIRQTKYLDHNGLQTLKSLTTFSKSQ